MIYYDVIISKSGLKIPLFSDGKPMHSKYDPEKEAETLISGINRSDYFLVLGLGGGGSNFSEANPEKQTF